MNLKARQILQKTDVDKLPGLPHIVLQLLHICHQDKPSFSDLTTTLRQDVGLYARVCSACHQNQCFKNDSNAPSPTCSGRYSVPLSEPTLKQLGINAIRSIVITTAVQQFFSRSSIEHTAFLKQHWQHSLYCAHVARAIAQQCNYSNPEEAYSTGLMHSIGQLVLETTYPDKYTATFARLTEDKIFHTMEQDEFSTTHLQIGAELLKKHGASNFIYDAVLYAHEKTEHILDAHPLVKIINLATSLIGSYFKKEDQSIFDSAEQLLYLGKPLLLEILENSQEQVKEIASLLEITASVDDMDDEAAKQQIASDEFKQMQLAEQIKNIALLDSIHQHLSRSGSNKQNSSTLLHTLSQHVNILFGVKRCLLFLYDATDDHVKAVAANGQPAQLADLSISLTAGRSLVTDALLNKQVEHSFDKAPPGSYNTTLSIIDRQLVELTGQTGIICLPIIMNSTTIGTLILGTDKIQHEALWQQLPLLTRFANEIAHSISADKLNNNATEQPYDKTSQLEHRIREALHEVNNPLSIMNNYLGILSYKLKDDKPAQENIQTIKAEIDRISHILNNLSDNEAATGKTSTVDINAIITDLSNIFRISLFASKNIDISLDLDERISSLQSNANALKQIYTNLIKNAVEALSAKGKVMVYTQDYVNVDGKQHIELVVADNGPGINTDILPQLFSPLKTTKGEEHAGLGLNIVKNLVAEIHGSISCRSSDKGTSFHILLPK